MKREYRYDRATITPVESGTGFLRARVAIARPGVFPYLYTDGDVRMEAKLPDEILSELTLSTAKGCPVTDGHPPLDDSRGMVTPENWSKYVKGALGDEVQVIDDMPWFNETVFDAGLIEELKNGNKVEVSIGFETDIDPTPGEFLGQKYDCVQRNIRINHVAHVDKGRAGETVRAYLDSANIDGFDIAVMKDNHKQETVMENKTTKQDTTKQDESAILDGMKRFFALFARNDDLEAAAAGVEEAKKETEDTPPPKNEEEAAVQNEQIALLKAQIDALQALLAEKTKLLEEANAPATMDAAISQRLELIELARSCVPDFKHDGMKNRDIKLAVIDRVLPFGSEVKKYSVSDVVINARFDAAAALAREIASRRDNSAGSVTLDEAEIMKKRNGRLNLHEVKTH
jgi:hypothetical protein